MDQLPLVKRDLASQVTVFSAKPNEINYINLALYAQHTATFTDRWMDAICWFSREQDGYAVIQGGYRFLRRFFSIVHNNPILKYKNDKIDRLFDVNIPHEHALPTVHFPLDEVYLVGDGNRHFTGGLAIFFLFFF